MSSNCPKCQQPHDATALCPTMITNGGRVPSAPVEPQPPIVDVTPVKVTPVIEDDETEISPEALLALKQPDIEQVLIDHLLVNKELPALPVSTMVGLTCEHCGSKDTVRFPAAYEWSNGASALSYLLWNQRTAIKRILHDKPGTDKELLALTSPPEKPDKPYFKLIIIAAGAGLLRLITALYATLTGTPRYSTIAFGAGIAIVNVLYYFVAKKEYADAVVKHNEQYSLWWQQWMCGQCRQVFREHWVTKHQSILSLDK